MKRALRKLVFVEPKSTHLHIYSRVGISAITSTAPQSYRLADQVRAAGGIVVMGGTHTSFLPDEGLAHADFVIRGEGEFAFMELVDAIQRGEGFEKIQNLSYRQDG